MSYSIIAMGTSWGGLSALTKLLGGLPEEFPIPIVVVQHRSKDSDRLLAQLLGDATPLKVCEVEDKDALCAGTVYVALIQDPKTAEIPIMPEAAVQAVPTAEVLGLDDLAARLLELSLGAAKVDRRTAV